jgi:hypothetical protein
MFQCRSCTTWLIGVYVRVERFVEARLYRCDLCRVSYAVPADQGLLKGEAIMAAEKEQEAAARKQKYEKRVAEIEAKVAALLKKRDGVKGLIAECDAELAQ